MALWALSVGVCGARAQSNDTVWFDDALPSNAGGLGADGDDSWNWISSNPAPVSGSLAHKSDVAAGEHRHWFGWSDQNLPISTGEKLFAYVYIDPANPPREIMLSWSTNTSWEHRAYWGENLYNVGTDGTASRHYVGPLPAAGQWVRLEVNASDVGLEGDAATGMAFNLYDGSATFDKTGKASAPPPPPSSNDTIWIDDALPPNAGGLGSYGGDSWNWVGSNPSPASGSLAHQSNLAAGEHRHWFGWSDQPLAIATGDKLIAYVYVDPANPPSEIMLSFSTASSWEHRAYWGQNLFNWGTDGTASRHYVGPIPATGQWVRLEVNAADLGLEGDAVTGMDFALYDGRVTWDKIGKSSAPPPPSSNDTIWIDDALPPNAGGLGSYGGDSWNWISSNPSPVSGSLAHQSNLAAGEHRHWFGWSDQPLPIATGETLIAYVYLDPANPPRELMLSFSTNTSWEHRAYWGENLFNVGTDGTPSRYHVGALPAAGQWVRLEVPAAAVGLEGESVTGMDFMLYDGRATWDKIGKSTPSSSGSAPIITAQPQSQTVATGSSVTFSVNATGTPAPSYQWQKNNTDIAGANAPTLTLDNVQSSDAASYRVRVSNAFGNVLSNSATLTVNPPTGDQPVITTQPQSQNANVGADVTFTVAATGAAPLSYQWRKNGVAISGATNDTLTLLNVQASAAGNYSVVVTNSAGSVPSNDAALTIGSGTPPPPPGGFARANYLDLTLPVPGDETMNVLSPTVIELKRINTKASTSSPVDSWDFVSGSSTTLQPGDFTVTVNGAQVAVTDVGFKRRALYAPERVRDLRIENAIYLKLAQPIADNQSVHVTSTRFPEAFDGSADPLRLNPAIHINQEGYAPNLSKIAMVGYYLGNLGELDVPADTPFKIINAQTGAEVFSNSQTTLVASPDPGWPDATSGYGVIPYQKVMKADFSSFSGTQGVTQYRLLVPGYGASLPFTIDDGIVMGFMRALALGLYHQRCGMAIGFPYTRFTHDACHTAAAEVPVSLAAYPKTWNFIHSYDNRINGPGDVNFPFVNTGPVDVQGGHHDAGDYSKYTIDSAALVSNLIFAVDAFPIGGRSDNLGIPESGDGIPDILQEAKWEADYLAKLQDADGGFYALVYPNYENSDGASEYEDGTPDRTNDTHTASRTQVVWPKSTASTAAAVAALAQIASSPTFKEKYPTEAATYLQKAQLGWQFLVNAINRFGSDENARYQHIYFYGAAFGDRDEIAWAACELFLATGDSQYRTQLETWFPNPLDRMGTYHDSWDPVFEGYGFAARSYAFAVQTGRLNSSQVNSSYLTACQNRILFTHPDDTNNTLGTALIWAQQNAYGASMPYQAKQYWGRVGYFHSLNRASDIAAAYALSPSVDKLTALVGNMDYEAGNNPVNVTGITGIGRKRQREIVSQWFNSDDRVLPGTGLTVALNVSEYGWLEPYGADLGGVSFPTNDHENPQPMRYPAYDRWTDTWNVKAEGVTFRQAGELISLCALASQTPSYLSQPWHSGTAVISGPSSVTTGQPATFTFSSNDVDPSTARIVWEGSGQEPAFGGSYTFTATAPGAYWVEVEAAAPDGRRVFARYTFTAQ